jgi:hypothetical protein
VAAPSCRSFIERWLLPNDGGAEHYRRRPCLVTVILLLLPAARCRSVGATAQQTAAAAAGRNCSLATSVSGVGAWHGTDEGEAVCLREARAHTVCFMSLRPISHSRVRHRSAPPAAIREHTTDTDSTFLGHETPPHKSSHSKEHGHRHRRHSTPETTQSLLGGKRRVRRTQQPRRSRTRNHRHDGTGSIQQQRRQHSGAHAREPRPAAGIIAEGEAVIGAASYATGEGPPHAPAAAAAAWRAGAIDVMQVRVHGAPDDPTGITSRRDEQGVREESVWRC